jgi:hypothetical protein
VREEYVSLTQAEQQYGVAIHPDSLKLDLEATLHRQAR